MRNFFLVQPGEPWQDHALCGTTDPDAFFDSKGVAEALAVCDRCPVRVECLHFALVNEEPFGIWGGMTPEERERLA